MLSHLAPAFRLTLVLTVLTGLLYPAAVTGVAQVLFPGQAHGSLISVDGRIVGSALIGQNFTKPSTFIRGPRRPARVATTPAPPRHRTTVRPIRS